MNIEDIKFERDRLTDAELADLKTGKVQVRQIALAEFFNTFVDLLEVVKSQEGRIKQLEALTSGKKAGDLLKQLRED